MTDDELREQFIVRTKHHIELVNKYGAMLGHNYSSHDHSKLELLLEFYKYFMVPPEDRTESQESILDLASYMHITNSPHHVEYWTDSNIDGWTRRNPTPNGPIDATDMPDECIEEMCCDWKAVGEEKGNTAKSWFNKVNGTRWIFSDHQQQLILDTLSKLGE